MGVDLHGAGGYFPLNWNAWCALLDLAQANGWKPAGTLVTDLDLDCVADDPATWDGSYTQNEYQIVTEDDAHNMADALERGLKKLQSDPVGAGASDRWIEIVRMFVAYCRFGKFNIG